MSPRPLDPREHYATRLRLWRGQCGNPPFRVLERRTGISRSTIHDRLSNGRALDWAFIKKIVPAIHESAKHLELDMAAWRRHYDQMVQAIELAERSAVWLGPIVPPADAYQSRAAVAHVDLIDQMGRTYVLQGTGGVGKTQIAAKLADHVWGKKAAELVVWVTATSRTAIRSAYAELAEALALEPDADPVRVLAKLAESTCPRWLIVFDDLQDPADIHGLWPPVGNGNVLVTTRRQDAILKDHRRAAVPVDEYAPAESQDYLFAKLGPEVADGADQIAAELGHLPLALDLATAYMIDLQLGSQEFLRRLRERRLEVLDPGDRSRAGVTSLWTMSERDADRHEPAGVAGPLLDVAAVLDANGIPADVFTSQPVNALVTRHRGRQTGEDDIRDGLACLQLFSLTRLDHEPRRVVRIHQLLQRSVRESRHDRCREAARAATDALEQVWPEHERDRSLIQMLRDNVDAVRRADADAVWGGGNLHQVVFRAGNSLTRDSLFAEAIAYWTKLRNEAEQRLGPEHEDTLSVRNNLAWSRGRAGDAAGALGQLAELLEIRQRVLGPEAVNTLATAHGVAVWQGVLGEVDRATALLGELIGVYRRRLGPDHQDTLNTRLALIEFAERRSPASVTDDLRSLLDDYYRVFGPDHERTWEVETDLVDNLAKTGAGEEAISRSEQIITTQIRVLGPEHLDTLESRFHFADLTAALGRPGEAAELMGVLLEDVTQPSLQSTPGLQKLRRSIEGWSRTARH